MQEHELRTLAQVGALETARKIVAEFPEVLVELNRRAGLQPGDDAASILAAVNIFAPGRRLTPAGRQAIVDAQRRRWARAKQDPKTARRAQRDAKALAGWRKTETKGGGR
jgi:hypothetical protein